MALHPRLQALQGRIEFIKAPGRDATADTGAVATLVSDILHSVQTRGDDAVREYALRFDKIEVDALEITSQERRAAVDGLAHQTRADTEFAIERVRTSGWTSAAWLPWHRQPYGKAPARGWKATAGQRRCGWNGCRWESCRLEGRARHRQASKSRSSRVLDQACAAHCLAGTHRPLVLGCPAMRHTKRDSMAMRKRSKKRNRRSLGSEPRATRSITGDASSGPTSAKARTSQSHRTRLKPAATDGERRRDLMRLLTVVMVPGRAFFAMKRPVPGVVCLGLQASLVGWLPAAIWAAWATKQVQQKQRALAARLRPG